MSAERHPSSGMGLGDEELFTEPTKGPPSQGQVGKQRKLGLPASRVGIHVASVCAHMQWQIPPKEIFFKFVSLD